MKLFSIGKDGGPFSTVTGYWLIELKKLFSIALLKFENGSRDEYHTHAFDSLSWVLKGHLREEELNGGISDHRPSLLPILTERKTFHRVFSHGTTWVFTLRGPWAKQWLEYSPLDDMLSVLEDGRVVVERSRP
jgi:hypothetical protein